MSVYEVMRQALDLPIPQRSALIKLLVDSLIEPQLAEKTHSIFEFEGIAAHLADDEDPQDYINRLRDEWDG